MAAGSVVGRGAYFWVEATRHHPAEFVVLVGDSAKARKGSSWDHVARLMARIDPGFAARVSTGLSTGEGLIWALRDPTGTDPGASDPRLLVVEPEFASVLKATVRERRTRSRRCCAPPGTDGPSRSSPAPPRPVPPPPTLVIGHITAAELRHHASSIEVDNGLLNRFCPPRLPAIRLLPEGGDPDPLRAPGSSPPGREPAHGRKTGEVCFTDEAPGSRGGRPTRSCQSPERARRRAGRTGRGPRRAAGAHLRAHRRATRIDLGHLAAALALFDYAARSAAWAFEEATGDPIAEQIHAASVTRRRAHPHRDPRPLPAQPVRAAAVDGALGCLAHAGRARPAGHHRRTPRTGLDRSGTDAAGAETGSRPKRATQRPTARDG